MERWRKSQTEKGKKTISTVISLEAHQVLIKAKEETQDSFSTTVDKALLMYGVSLEDAVAKQKAEEEGDF